MNTLVRLMLTISSTMGYYATTSNNNIIKCGNFLEGLHGQFNTPNFPHEYPNKLSCKWNIVVPKGYRLRLNFTQFELEWTDDCGFDYVKVIANNKTIGKYCGHRSEQQSVPPLEPFLAPDNTLEVLLKTDYSNEVEVHGFEAHFAAIDVNECEINNGGCAHFCHNFIGGFYCSCRIGYRLVDDNQSCRVQCQNILSKQQEGIIKSPEYPKEYPPFAQCDYHITAEKGYYINLQFLDFHIEDHEQTVCPYDYLLIEDAKSKLGPFCGRKSPPKIRTISNWVIIEFYSDKSVGYSGFKAKYWLEGIKCPLLSTPDFGNMAGPRNFTFKETLEFSCEKGFEQSGSKTRTCQADGTWTGVQTTCIRIRCSDPVTMPEDGSLGDPIGGNVYYYGYELDIYCSPFHDIFGSRKMICQENKTWSGGDAYCVKTCGRTIIRNEALESCPKGRHRAKTMELFQPWVVAIKNHGKLICTGMLISQQWVITASHCLDGKAERHGLKGGMEVVLGAQYWARTEKGTVTRKVTEAKVRQKYDYGIHSDIALLKLDTKVKLSRFIQPICLPDRKHFRHLFKVGKSVASVGWQPSGLEEYKTDRCLQIIPKADCTRHTHKTHKEIQTKRYGNKNGRANRLPVDLMCLASTVGKSDICETLPGSGLVNYDNKTNKWYLGGILTWGSNERKHCKAYMNTYDIYSKVHKYVKWIRMETRLNIQYPDTNYKIK